ncbi:MAG: hypothetical protein M1816_000492 [Peltula sp. TS41687]|nr:MAG: hypothetical protein M1816_000492 [Peltula sp. TS41687]
MLPPPAKKRKVSRTQGTKTEEVLFDAHAREEYLNGFHKRKVARIKQAQAVAARRERVEKLEQRKKLRQERKEEAQRHVEGVNTWLRREARGGDHGSDTNSSTGEGEDEEEEEEEEGGKWNGFEEEEEKEEKVDREDEYIDEERYTTVTVEAIDVSREGLRSVVEGEQGQEESGPRENGRGADGEEGRESKSDERREKKAGRSKDHPDRTKKKKKKSFRYENKAERKVTKTIQRAARARKGRKS